jgi:p-hydroxybenzoate 3-monooxygenase
VRTQVGIVGAGPAGLLLGHLLDRAGIANVVLEARSRGHVERRVRAGVLTQDTVEALEAAGVAGRLHREGLVHRGIELRFGGERHRVALPRPLTVYGQQEVVKDLVAARSGPLLFETPATSVDAAAGRIEHAGGTLECELVAGCDGFHGVCRAAMPARTYERRYPAAWLGILAAVPPSTEEIVYAHHERGFALHSMRSPHLSRLYVQVAPDDVLEDWPDERVWAELRERLACDGWSLADGPVLEKSLTPVRSFMAEPMRFGRLVLAGDAAHIVPPTGAKGLNLAVGDVVALSRAVVALLREGDDGPLAAYAEERARVAWRVQDFCSWLTEMLHRLDATPIEARRQRAALEHLVGSESATRSFAARYGAAT